MFNIRICIHRKYVNEDKNVVYINITSHVNGEKKCQKYENNTLSI